MSEIYRGIEAYNQDFDRRPGLSPSFIKLQLEKLIGERFNVLLSTTRYEVKGSHVFGEESDEPFMDVLVRGRDYRRLYGNSMDRGRENAEVLGFQKMEKIMTDTQTPEGTMVLSFSLKGREGSTYQHNFYDVFRKNSDRSIEARRYSCALNEGEAAKFYLEMGFDAHGELADDVFFLSNPILINDPRFKTPDDLHKYLHRDHEFTTVEEFERIRKGIQSRVIRYAYNPTSFNFDAALNAADIEAGLVNGDINDAMLGFMPVRRVMTGCGASGQAEDGVYSVSEFGESKWFVCPKCGWRASGPIGNGPCGRCGLTKDQFAKEGGQVC